MKVIKSEDDWIEFDNGLSITGEGERDCCAVNYLDCEQLPVGTEVQDMTLGELIDAISLKDDGFSIKDINGLPKWVQARSEQNGYYSDITAVYVEGDGKKIKLGELSGEQGY